MAEDTYRVCSKTGLGRYQCPGNYTCGNPIDFNIPLSNENIINNDQINYGVTNFDNVYNALMSVLFITIK